MPQPATSTSAQQALQTLWHGLALPPEALAHVHMPAGPTLPPLFASSFAIGTAAQAAVAATSLMSSLLGQWRQGAAAPRQVQVEQAHALAETTGYFTVDGRHPDLWAPISGLYPCGDALGEPGWVRIHANFDHHRDGALRLLALPAGSTTTREHVQAALRHWRAPDFEAQAAERGLVVAAVRTRDEWLAHPQHSVVAQQPLIALTQLDAERPAPPMPWPALPDGDAPLAGLRVLDLTRILAGPVAARTLAAQGADVLMINSPHLPNIEAIADVSRGKRSALLDLHTEAGRARLHDLVGQAHVFLQGYHPGGLDALGFSPQALAAARPGLVYASLSAYGRSGPWADRRGFDSLVQTVSGINAAEQAALGVAQPKALPVQILDYCAGFLLAFGMQAALWRQQTQGGSWHVQINLARMAEWLWSLGGVAPQLATPSSAAAVSVDVFTAPYLETQVSGFGQVRAVRHSGLLQGSRQHWPHPAAQPGQHAAQW